MQIADQVLRVPAGGPARPYAWRLLCSPSSVFVNTRGRRTELQQCVGVAAREPNADGRRRRQTYHTTRHSLPDANGNLCDRLVAECIARGANAGRQLRLVVGHDDEKDRILRRPALPWHMSTKTTTNIFGCVAVAPALRQCKHYFYYFVNDMFTSGDRH